MYTSGKYTEYQSINIYFSIKQHIYITTLIPKIIFVETSHSTKQMVSTPLRTTQAVLLHINRQTILTPDEIANSTYIYNACQTRMWSATITSASQSALISESSMPIG
jgi:hypothetical protein